MIIVFLKLTVLPLLSVKRPSSKTCNNILNTSGCAFFYFIEQDDRIWFAAYCLRQLSTFIISNVSRRRTNQTSRTELLLVFAHINTCHHVLVVKQIICQRLGQFCFSDTCRSQENKRTDWTFRVLQAGTASSNGICNGMNSLVPAQ